MQRIEFLSRISLTALLVSGIRQNLDAKKTNLTSDQNVFEFEIANYPIDRTKEILSSILAEVNKGEIEFNLFLDSFAKELEVRFPLQDKNKISSYKELYSFSIKMEILCELTIMLIGIWQNLCIQIGFDGYQIRDFKTDSNTIKNAMIGFGNKIQNHKIPMILEHQTKKISWKPFKISLRLPWFGGIKTEKLISYTIDLEQIFGLDPKQIKGSNQSEISLRTTEFFSHTTNLINLVDGIRARWHQYAVRFYYMEYAQRKYESWQNLKMRNSHHKHYQNLIRSYSFESAMETIQNRAYHMQSGVYHSIDRQSQQMVVSSLVLMMKDLGKWIGVDRNLFRTLKLENSYGGIISVSTGMSAIDSLKNLEQGIRFLKEERKKFFAEETL
ncbi:hypothetical protein [Leptospira jelokensis]|uniref:Uncharacterized protein n=1 Tax=Leptospira jelokensis TaxID=2484931 RepID=A0A4Z1A175_9LEPT|nr:hypothetical protein [Leptospira jelokensis]TGL70744.1 hypothetical protein EHQ62_07145 [Leptospira jelokensis]